MGASGFLSLGALSDLTNVGSLAAFTLVCVTVIYLRSSDPHLKRPFRVPFYPLTPILGALMCLLLLWSLMAMPETRHFFLAYLTAGIILYFAYGIRTSRLSQRAASISDAQLPHEGS
jgi:APA family basic amino acid/polyamine antiporter